MIRAAFVNTEAARRARGVVLALVVTGAAFAAGSAYAQDYTYEIDGYGLTDAEASTLRQSDQRVNQGIDALQAGQWAAARRHCEAGLAGYLSTGLPDAGQAAAFYSEARACIADAAWRNNQQDYACELYRENDWKTLGNREMQGPCEQREAAAEEAYQAWEDYRVLFSNFSDQTGSLQTFEPGSAARTAAGARLRSTCARLGSYSAHVAGATPAAGYCNGILLFEAGDFDGACRSIWQAAGQAQAISPSSLSTVQGNHIRDLRETLGGFRGLCSEEGSPWPAFGGSWS